MLKRHHSVTVDSQLLDGTLYILPYLQCTNLAQAGSRSAAVDPSKLSHHIYRVGYHFRTDIFDDACRKLGYSERNGKLEKTSGSDQPTRFEQTMSRYGSRFDAIDINNRSEEESMKVKKHIRELFPKIPEADLEEIYIRAWEQVSSLNISYSPSGRSNFHLCSSCIFHSSERACHEEE